MGIAKEEIRSRFLGDANPGVGERFIDLLIEQGHIEQRMENILLSGFEIEYDDLQTKIKDEINQLYKDAKFVPPKLEEVSEELQYEKQEIYEVFNSLVNRGDIVKLNENLYSIRITTIKPLDMLKEYLYRADPFELESIGTYWIAIENSVRIIRAFR